MTERSANPFRLKAREPKGREASRARVSLSHVAAKIGKAGDKLGRPPGACVGSAPSAGAVGSQDSRRIRIPGPAGRVITNRQPGVMLRQATMRSAAIRLRYIVRESPTVDGKGADPEAAEVKPFEERGRDDRDQFPFIIAPEDGVELHDLRDSTGNSRIGWKATSALARTGSRQDIGLGRLAGRHRP